MLKWLAAYCLLLVYAAIAEEEAAAPTTPTDRVCKTCFCNATTVDCSDRSIEEFFTIEDWLGIPQNVTTIDLSGNMFPNVTAFPRLPSLRLLNISNCGIVDIEDDTFKELPDLAVLDLSRNRLTSAALHPNVFEGRYSPLEYEPLEALRTLDLSHNDLHSLNKDLFEHLPELTELILNDNPFGVIDHSTVIAIAGLPDLKVLRMRGCELTDVPERFLHTPRDLQQLDLSDNRLAAVPQELGEARSLQTLNLNQNPIRRLDVTDEEFLGFPKLTNLKELHLCNMPELEFIGDYSLGGLSSLETLHLRNNPKLSVLEPKALARVDDVGDSFVWPPLKNLYIDNNALSSLDSRLVSRWDRLATLHGEGNPYVCDCTTQWMTDVLAPIAENLEENSTQLYVCDTPIEMKGQTMFDLNAKKRTLRCLDKYNHRPERDGALLLGTLIGVLLAVPLVLTLVLLWRRGYFAVCGGRGPADYSRAFYKRAETEDFHI